MRDASLIPTARSAARVSQSIETNVRRALLPTNGSVMMPDALTSVLIVLSLAVLAFGVRENRRR